MALTPFQLRALWERSPGGADVDAQRALAARLDGGVAGLHQDREVGLQQVRVALGELAQPVVDRVDLLGLVEDEGQVAVRLGHVGGELEHHRVAALHVAGAEAVQDAVLEARGQVVVERHGVEVTGDDHALAAAELGAGDDRVAAPGDGEVREAAQRGLDRVGDLLLVVAHRLDVDELLGQGDDVGGQVEVGHGLDSTSRAAAARLPVRAARPSRSNAGAQQVGLERAVAGATPRRRGRAGSSARSGRPR